MHDTIDVWYILFGDTNVYVVTLLQQRTSCLCQSDTTTWGRELIHIYPTGNSKGGIFAAKCGEAVEMIGRWDCSYSFPYSSSNRHSRVQTQVYLGGNNKMR